MILFNEERRLIESDPAWRQVREARERFQRLLDEVLSAGASDGSFTIPDLGIARMSILGIVNHMPQWLDPTAGSHRSTSPTAAPTCCCRASSAGGG